MIVRPEDAPNGPPLQVRPPERIQEAPYVYDAFKSDIFSIGKTLELEWLPNASKVSFTTPVLEVSAERL